MSDDQTRNGLRPVTFPAGPATAIRGIALSIHTGLDASCCLPKGYVFALTGQEIEAARAWLATEGYITRTEGAWIVSDKLRRDWHQLDRIFAAAGGGREPLARLAAEEPPLPSITVLRCDE